MTQALRTTTSHPSRRISQFQKRRSSGTSRSKTRNRRSRKGNPASTSQSLSNTTSKTKSQPSRSSKQPNRRFRQKNAPANLWQPQPLWLRILQQWQRSSSAIAFLLAIAACIAYAYATHYQQRWNQVYQRTEQLRTEERQLHAYQELLKNQVATDAQSENTELVPPDPNQILFVEPAPVRDFQKPSSTSNSEPSQPISNEPLGY